MRKEANRLNFDFNKAEDEYIDGDEVVGLGRINKEGSGRLRLVASQQKVRGPQGADLPAGANHMLAPYAAHPGQTAATAANSCGGFAKPVCDIQAMDQTCQCAAGALPADVQPLCCWGLCCVVGVCADK
jgi:hypothetical protein